MRNPYFRRSYSDTTIFAGVIGVIGILSFVASLVCAWLTHVIVSIQTASWVLLVVGAFVPPIGVIHGFMIWFGLI